MAVWRSIEAYFAEGGECSVSFAPSEIPTGKREDTKGPARGELDTEADGRWHCPHPTEGEHDRCLFHLEPSERPSESSVSDRLLDVLRTPADGESRRTRRRRKQFLGARLPDLQLTDEVVSGADNFAIDLRGADVGTLSLDNARLDDPLDVRGAEVERLSATNAEFSRFYAHETAFGSAVFDHASLERAYFDRGSADLLRFYGADITYADFEETRADRTSFLYATLGGVAFFDADLGVATFFAATFDGGFFNGASFDYLNFRSTSGEECHFDGTSAIAATFETSDFQKVRLDETTFDRFRAPRADWDTASADGASLGIATFDDARFGEFSLADVTIGRSVSFDDVLVEKRLRFSPDDVDGEGFGYVSWRRADLPTGAIRDPENTAVVHDFADATLGDIRVESEADQLLDQFRFLRTEFAGFDFSKQPCLDLEAAEHVIHEVGADPAELATLRLVQETVTGLHPAVDTDLIGAASQSDETDLDAVDPDAAPDETGTRAYDLAVERAADGESSWEANPSIDDLETTYLMAKTGASAVGDSTASGQFFVKERTYRRYGHWAAARGQDPTARDLSRTARLGRASAWLRNWLFAMTAGYGERPVRTILASAGTIVLFSVPYTYLEPPVEGTTDPSYVDYLVFSFQSFITFIVGSTLDDPPLSIRVVSSVEGFVGAFFVALFVFALTRQVHR